jgi:hypothetical protein
MPKEDKTKTKSDAAEESTQLPPSSHAYILVLYDLGVRGKQKHVDVSTNVNKNQLWRCGIFVGRVKKDCKLRLRWLKNTKLEPCTLRSAFGAFFLFILGLRI